MRRRPATRPPGRHLPPRKPPHLDGTTFLVVYAALLLLIPAPLIVGPIGAAGTPAALWGMVGLLWWAAFRVGGLGPGRGASPVRLALGAFVLCVLASYAWSMTTGWYAPADIHQVTDDVYDLVPPTPDELRDKMFKAADRGLLALSAWAGVVLMCLDAIRRRADLDRCVRWVVGFTTVVAFIGLVQFFTGFRIAGLLQIPGLVANSEFGTVHERSVLRRVYATGTHPIEFGVVLGSLFPLALHQAMFATRRVLPWIPPLAIGTAATMSVSRSAVLALGAGLVVLFIGWPPAWRGRFLVIFPLAAVTLRLLVPGLLGTILSMWRNLFADPSTTGRTDDYAVVFRVLADSPLLGRGQFTFIPQYYRTMDNQLLVSLLELGAVGLAALLGLLLTAYLCARGVRLRTVRPKDQHLGLALSASLVGMFTSYLTFDALGFPMAAGVTFLLVGLAGAAWQVARAEEVRREATGATEVRPGSGRARLVPHRLVLPVGGPR